MKQPYGPPRIWGPYEQLVVRFDPEIHALWYHLRPRGRPCFNLDLLDELRRFQHRVEQVNLGPGTDGESLPIRYMVLASTVPGVFNLGGDLQLFAEMIRQGDREGLFRYAKACIDVLYPNSVSFEQPMTTITLVQGDALGGGFESVLGSDVIIAESHAKFGLPEILFGLFPAMGAYSFLGRRIGAKAAEEMIMSGRIFTARELADRGIVDRVAEPGEGESAVRAYIGEARRKFAAYRSIYQVRRRFHPLTYDEMIDIANLWVEAALSLEDAHVRRMTTLASAQLRRQGPAMDTSAEKPAKPVA